MIRLSEKADSLMHKVQSTAVVRWMADRDLAVCGALNRMSRPPKIKKFFVVVSWLGNGKVWYLLMVALPLLYGDKGVATSWAMVQGRLPELCAVQDDQACHRASAPLRGEHGNYVGHSAARSIQLSIRTHDARGGLFFGRHGAPSGVCRRAHGLQQPHRLFPDHSWASLSYGCSRRRVDRRIRGFRLVDAVNSLQGRHFTGGSFMPILEKFPAATPRISVLR